MSVVRLAVVLVLLVTAAASSASAQRGGGGGAPQAPPSPQASAPIDLTGYWVAIVTEDWRWRMVTPQKGDFPSVPLNADARKIAESWDSSTDGSCLAYGAGALMRMPTRLNITWENENVLKIETDAGQQTRRFVFDKATAPPGQRSLQGFSLAEWERPARGGGGGGAPAAGAPPAGGRAGAAQAPRVGNLKVITTLLSGGWLQRNGVPYSEAATVTEYYDRLVVGNDTWLVVTTIVSDSKYLTQDFITSSHFRREADGAKKWDPTPCKAAL
jgi:hypothetical protein